MRSGALFSGELSFLNDFPPLTDNPYRHSRFLESDFDASVWHMRTGESPLCPIDFRVRLDDGLLLTDHKHRHLLEVFKCWICVQDHPNACSGRLNSSSTARNKINRTLHLIDYLLLNAPRIQLSRHGLMSITANEVRGLLIDLGSGVEIRETLYGYSRRLAQLLLTEGAKLDSRYVAELVTNIPELALRHEEDGELELDENQLVRARAWLWSEGYYRRAPTNSGHLWTPNMVRLWELLYPNTLCRQVRNPIVPELLLDAIDIGYREHQRAPINARGEEELPTQRHISTYVAVMRPLELLALASLKVPLEMLQAIDEPVAGHYFPVKAPGRFRNLPQELVLSSLRQSVEFLLSHGDIIVDGYLHMMSEWKRSNLPFVQFARSNAFKNSLPKGLRALGVAQWCVRRLPDGHRPTMQHIPPAVYFKELRANVGLYDLLQVLYGAALLMLGTLSARRVGELEELPLNCLDKSRTRIVFFNRKSAEGDMREREMRPVPRVAVRTIEMLQRLASELKSLGLAKGHQMLFGAPSRMTGLPCKGVGGCYTGRLLDMLCDYIQTPLDEYGRRYYIRQHQLRRFFVTLFFWGGAFGGLDTLRWFLGHTDPEHLWHYISESIPGAALRNVKVNFAVSQVLDGAPAADALANLLELHYGTREFSVLDTEELDLYVEELMIEGTVSVEPEFLHLNGDRTYRVLIVVTNLSKEKAFHA